MPTYRKYGDVNVGDRFPDEPGRFTVTAEAVAAYRDITAGSLRSGQPTLAADGDEAPAMLAAVYVRIAQNAVNAPPGGIHAKQRFEFVKPVRVGDQLATRLTVREKYEKNGRRYLLSDVETANQAGEIVTRGRWTTIWGQGE